MNQSITFSLIHFKKQNKKTTNPHSILCVLCIYLIAVIHLLDCCLLNSPCVKVGWESLLKVVCVYLNEDFDCILKEYLISWNTVYKAQPQNKPVCGLVILKIV